MNEDSFIARMTNAWKLLWRRAIWKIGLVYMLFCGAWIVIAVIGVIGFFVISNHMDSVIDVGPWYRLMAAWTTLMVVGQTLATVLHRPMHRAVFAGPDYDDEFDNIFRLCRERIGPVFGVNALIGLVLHASPYPAISMLFDFSIEAWGAEGGFALFLLFGLPALFLLWCIVCLVTLFVFAPAPYIAATRDLGVFESLWEALKFLAVNFFYILAGGLVFATGIWLFVAVATVFSPLYLLTPVVGLVALVYWHVIFAALEADKKMDGQSAA